MSRGKEVGKLVAAVLSESTHASHLHELQQAVANLQRARCSLDVHILTHALHHQADAKWDVGPDMWPVPLAQDNIAVHSDCFASHPEWLGPQHRGYLP